MEHKSRTAPRAPRPASEPRRALDGRDERPDAPWREETRRNETRSNEREPRVERCGPLPGEVWPDEARFGSFN